VWSDRGGGVDGAITHAAAGVEDAHAGAQLSGGEQGAAEGCVHTLVTGLLGDPALPDLAGPGPDHR